MLCHCKSHEILPTGDENQLAIRSDPNGTFWIWSRRNGKNDVFRSTLYFEGVVVELAQSIPKALLNGIDTEPLGHVKLEDLYYVTEGRNELPGTFLSRIPFPSLPIFGETDRSVGIISLGRFQ
uniref:Uncharacterized protein n=1 Tax=Vespula pensylvanica TaxID=30213 RepID=A0A834KH82_VESPE|nr:hypothetical protein H0235_014357 [Vespula pensylvanica]